MTQHERIFVTGQSGISIEKSIEKFIALKRKQYSKYNQNIVFKIYKVESFITDIFKENDSSTKNTTPKKIWSQILNIPYTEIQKYWDFAAKQILELIAKDEESSLKEKSIQVSFILFHSVYYHKKTNEFFPCINIDLLKQLSPTKVINLIDDIYDIHHRLSKPHELFHHAYQVSKFDLIIDLMIIQDWRDKELMMSRFIAKQIANHTTNPKFYVFAVKHPYNSFENLFRNKSTVYFSHPISEIRRLEKRGDHKAATNLITELNQFRDILSEYFCLFLPTTIDEFRIHTLIKETKPKKPSYSKKDPHQYLVCQLTKRWDEEFYLQEQESILFEISNFKTNALWEDLGSRKRTDLNLANLLKALKFRIASQVTVRDYALVEQSDLLVIYRPLFNGNLSSGVGRENEYFNNINSISDALILSKKGANNTFIYCPKKDVIKYIENIISRNITRCEKEKVFIGKDIKNQLVNLSNSLAELLVDVMKIDEKIKKEIINLSTDFFITNNVRFDFKNAQSLVPSSEIESPNREDNKPLPGGGEETLNQKLVEAVFVDPFIEEFSAYFLYKEAKLFEQQDDTSPSNFAEKIKAIIAN